MEETVQGLYIISVASRLIAMHPQTLRKYERMGFIAPARTIGMLRLYSERDLQRLRLIKHLVEDLELNLAGVELTLQVWDRLVALREAIEQAADEMDLRRAIQEQLGGILDLLESTPE
ncbi:MAG: MerR family transcriptional regulator [Chloroflexi bacterium]|nr:MerR family transcriptional regulator [Chloroflexota bacterium]